MSVNDFKGFALNFPNTHHCIWSIISIGGGDQAQRFTALPCCSARRNVEPQWLLLLLGTTGSSEPAG